MTTKNARATTTNNDASNVTNETQQTNAQTFVTLQSIIRDRKIKHDQKLIRRVLRKYYAQQTNHQLRDRWLFDASKIDDVVAIIDKHCRANKSQNDVKTTNA